MPSFLPLHMFGQLLLPVTLRFLQFAEILRLTAFNSSAEWGSARLMRYLWQTAFLWDCGRTHLFLQLVLVLFKAVGVVISRGHRSNLAAISTTVGSTVPL